MGVDLGYSASYPMAYDQVFLFDKKGDLMFPIAASLGSANTWGEGSQASGMNGIPMPASLKLRWFSVTKNTFYEGEYQFDKDALKKYKDYITVTPFVYNRKFYAWREAFLTTTFWTINVTPGGMVVVWITGGNSVEKYVLAHFQAKRVDMDWDEFIHRLYGRLKNFTYPDRATYIKNALEDAQTKTKGKAPQNVPDISHWQRYFKTYRWQLQLNDALTLKDYETRMVNGERVMTYDDADQTKLKPRAAPYMLDFFAEKNDSKKLQRYRVELGDFFKIGFRPENWDELLQAFEKLGGQGQMITIKMNMDREDKNIDVVLSNDIEDIKLQNVHAEKTDLYSDYSPVICRKDDPSKALSERDISIDPDDSQIFVIKSGEIKYPTINIKLSGKMVLIFMVPPTKRAKQPVSARSLMAKG